MGKGYYRLIFWMYWLSLIICVGCQTALKLWHMSLVTGFYNGGGNMVPVLRLTLAAAIILWFLLTFIRGAGSDYPVSHHSRFGGLLAILCAGAVLTYTFSGVSPDYLRELTAGDGSSAFESTVEIIKLVLGFLSAIAFICVGVSGLRGKGRPPMLLTVVPVIWQTIVLLSRFNSYNALTAVSDNLFAVLFMVFAAAFFMGHARAVCGVGRTDGRSYVIPVGLSVSLCGFLLTLPNYLYMIYYGGANMSAVMLSVPESVYACLVSLYAIVFVLGYIKSIRKV